jgi:mannose-6-phosphate isomerase-like protein (cupin superfamily)
MKRVVLFLGAAGLALAAGAVAVASSKLVTVKQPSELSFAAVRPGAEQAVLWGNPKTGEWGGVARRSAGNAEAWHTHSHDLRLVVLSGTARVEGTAQGSVELEPSSYVDIPAYARHRLICGSGADCTWLVQQTGSFDMLPEGSASIRPTASEEAFDEAYYMVP